MQSLLKIENQKTLKTNLVCFLSLFLFACSTEQKNNPTTNATQPNTSTISALLNTGPNKCEPKGNYWDGELVNGIHCTPEFLARPDRLEVATHPESQFATKEMRDLILQTADWAFEKWGGAVKIRVGDIAFEKGGKLARHRTHQTGLDADIAYIPVNPKPIVNNGRKHNKFPEKFVKRGRVTKNLDIPKTYELISCIVEHYDVKLFVDRRIISALRGVKLEGQSPDLRERMFANMEHNPSHQDHFHVKLMCPAQYKYCRNEMEKRRWYKYQRKKWPKEFGVSKKYNKKQQTIYYTLEKNQTIQVNTTHSLESGNKKITRVIVAIHGIKRNAKEHFEKIKKIVDRSGGSEKIMVVVPNFKNHGEKFNFSSVSWDEGWVIGDQATEESDLTSYDVVDHIMKKFLEKEKFPNLKTIVLTGIAAGAEFVQRYAAGNSVENESKDVRFKYLVMAPASYMYLTPQRLNFSNETEFSIPTMNCQYNDYAYGLANRNNYMNRINEDVLKEQYIIRDVHYFANDLSAVKKSKKSKAKPKILNDDTLDSEPLDQECEAELQGRTRTERAQIFKNYLDKLFPQNKHTLSLLPGKTKKLEIYDTKEMKRELLE